MKTIITILNYIDVGAPFVTLFFFIKPFKRLSRELLYIFAFVCIQLTTNVAASVFELLMLANYSIYAANIVLSYFLLSVMFYKAVGKIILWPVIGVSVLFAACAVVSITRGDGIHSYNSIVSAVASFIITAYCLVYFYWKLVKDKQTTVLTDSAFFWVIIGIFTYYTGSFFIFISYKYLIVQGDRVLGILWRFHNLLLALFCIYTIYGLTCKNYQKT